MCGIVGYITKDIRNNFSDILVNQLKRLTYRGYDSWGFAFKEKEKISIIKNVGDIENFNFNLNLYCDIGIGHTRWATHGKVSKENAHPHTSCDENIVLVHNGIIENYKELKEYLKKSGHEFKSETDTEVIPHLIEENYKKHKDIVKASIEAAKYLKGSFAFALISSYFDGIIAFRNGAPLIIGVGNDEAFVSSDVISFLDRTKNVIYLEDEEFAIIKKDKDKIDVKIFNIKTREEIKKQIKHINWSFEEATKQGFEHFMIKEIFEQPKVIENALLQDKDFILNIAMEILRAKNIVITACGTSRYAAIIGRYLFSKIAKKFCDVIMASEFHYFSDSIDKNTLVIAVSQSGETADVLTGVKKAKENGAKIISIVNVMDSSLARLSDYVIYINAGPEICVAATKSFTAQLIIFYLLAFSMVNSFEYAKNKLLEISKILEENLKKNNKNIKEIAKKIKDFKDFYYIGRGINFAMASEGALKMKEISYIHAEGMPAGELKHGTIALIEKDTPVIAVCPNDYTFYETISNVEETKARGALVIGISDKKDKSFDYWIEIPSVEEIFYPLVTIIPLQLLAYHVAVEKGLNPDKPRNLAKSVTVK